MIRLIIILLGIALALFGARWLQSQYRQKGRPFLTKALLVAAAILLIGLAATGRTHWVGAAAASIVAALRFMMPILIKSLPFLQQWYSQKQRQEDTDSQRVHSNSGKMTRNEALAILGLSGEPSKEDITEAHRKLVQKVHPDRGGSEFLTTQLNQARDTLLG